MELRTIFSPVAGQIPQPLEDSSLSQAEYGVLSCRVVERVAEDYLTELEWEREEVCHDSIAGY